MRHLRLLLGLLGFVASAHGQTEVTGTVIEHGSRREVPFAAITLQQPDGTMVQQTITDAHGRFRLENVPAGDYAVLSRIVGGDAVATRRFSAVAGQGTIELGVFELTDPAVQMGKVEVKAGASPFLNRIDRKVYLVGSDIQGVTGSASDLLQNVPSVQVDLDGRVSLRGSENVLILIDGRTSVLMGKSRAEVLQQLPADSIERIEVITNPSAKFKPDGTAGIINLALKRKRAAGFSGTANVAMGDQRRYQAGISANYGRGKTVLFGSYSVRQDDRERWGTDVRTSFAPDADRTTRVEKSSHEESRPFSHTVRAGAEYSPTASDKLGTSVNYHRRTLTRHALDSSVTRVAPGGPTVDYDRVRTTPEVERATEVMGTWRHKFPGDDHELSVELKASFDRELEDNHFADIYRSPARSPSFERITLRPREDENELTVEYTRALDEQSKLEAGYVRTANELDSDFHAETADGGSTLWITDVARSNRFGAEQTIDAFYATYGRTFGKLGVLAGVRPEWASVTSRLVNTGATIPNRYARVYPSLHLAYQFTDRHEAQLNYSHRVNRPDPDELNPFPEYTDPLNLHAGNPRLLPEDIHSLEAGYGYRHDETGFTSTIYHRYRYHGFASITRDLGGGVLLTTQENLARSEATGLELTANAALGGHATFNFSSNTFFNTIDASNLGYRTRKSDVSTTAKLAVTVQLPRRTTVQFNANYTSSRLTAQGSRRPSWFANSGVRHEFGVKKTAVVLTVSDMFDSLRERTVIRMPLLQQQTERRRRGRIVYLGIRYHFGQPPKKMKEDPMQFDNAL
ncbi:MAG: TonB-dependent receptor [Opitutaceae bacterium]|nr:TonB-dependent receptor [Opitutaceae bacterium]